MFVRYYLRQVLLCTALQFCALMGAPLLPREIEHLMRSTHGIHWLENTQNEAGRSKDDEPNGA
jgi:hypothetical protein